MTLTSDAKQPETPRLTRRDPSLPIIPTTSRAHRASFQARRGHSIEGTFVQQEPSRIKKCLKFLYNRDDKTMCDRTFGSWISIVTYSLMYLVFLSTYTMIFLYGSLVLLKNIPETTVDLMSYPDNSIGLTATPTSVNSYPLIWYRLDVESDYEKYVGAIDKLLQDHRRKRDVSDDLGPCSQPPYGYGERPCVLVRINKRLRWAGAPLRPGSLGARRAPPQVRAWMRADTDKYWLHCTGYHPYDNEHIGTIKYYPDPPGFDVQQYPVSLQDESPLVAVQVSNFTLGISLAIECKLWYEDGESSVAFMLYVARKSRVARNLDVHN